MVLWVYIQQVHLVHLWSKLRNSNLFDWLLVGKQFCIIHQNYLLVFFPLIRTFAELGGPELHAAHKMQAHHILIWQCSDIFFSSSMQVFSPSKANWSLWKDREGWEAATSQNSSWNPSFRICKLQSLVKSFHFCPQKTAQWGYLVTWTEQRNPLNALQHIVSWLGAESCSAKAHKPGLLWKLRAPFSRLQTSGDAFSG